MTHVLQVTTWHPYIDGIAGLFVLEQAAALQAAGVDVGMIFSRIEGLRSFTYPRMARGLPGVVRLSEPVPTIGFKSWCPPKASAIAPRIHDLVLKRLYGAYVRSHGTPHLLHGHVALEAGGATRAIARGVGLPYVITEHSSEILAGRLTPARAAVARTVYGDAKCVLAVSGHLAEQVRRISPSAHIRVVGNVVRDSVFRERRAPRHGARRFRVVTISSLGPNKRVNLAIEALSQLPGPLRERIDYVVVGEGRERPHLESLARASGLRVEFRGNLPHAEAMAVLADADLLLHPSVLETFGIVLAEALALGVPVIATRCGGPEEFLSDRTGALVARDDVEELTSATRHIFEDIGRWRRMADALSEYAASRFSEASVARAIMESYG